MRQGYQPNSFTIAEVRAFWDSVADEYVHEDEALAEAHFQRFERAFRHFQPREGMRALNVWSRAGEAVEYFRRVAPRLDLVNAEVSPRMLAQATARYPGEKFISTDLRTLPFADEEFDFILSLETVEHTPDPLAFVRELARVLKPGGRLVLSCPPATAELPLKMYELFRPNHGEGPHRFPASREVRAWLHAAGLELRQHESTLFVPVGPRFLRRLDSRVERMVARTPLRELGIRQFFVAERPREAGPWRRLLREVVETDLCTRCGTCVGVCPKGVLELDALDDACVPYASRPQACTQCGLCVACCPGARVYFADVHAAAADAPVRSAELGPLRRIRVAHASHHGMRWVGASGGAVTAILCDLLDRGEITGGVVLDARHDAPWRPWPRIARTREEIVHAAQSKYCVTPTNVILREIEPAKERLAVVALPCQIHALRRLEQNGHPLVKAVALIIGLYCGNQLHFGATRSFLKRHGVHDLTEVASIRYRDGAWPGNVRCDLQDGRSFAVPKLHFNHLISIYVMPRCLLCTDLAAEGADLSVADAWGLGDAARGGESLVVSRTARGESTVADLVARGVLEAQEIDLDRALAMHAHGLDLKKTGAFLRIQRLKRQGKPAPRYDLPEPEPPLRRRFAEVFISGHFRLLRTRAARAVVDRIPFRLLGGAYTILRTAWKDAAARKYGQPAEPAAENQGSRSRWFRLLGPLLLLIMLWRIGLGECWSVVRGADLFWFLAACGLSVPGMVIKGWRWQEILRSLGFRLSLRASTGIYAAGMLAGAVTPGKIGDLAKAPLLIRRGLSWTAGLAGSLLDRLFDGVVVCALGLGGILALPNLPGRGLIAVAAAVAIGLTAAAAIILRQDFARALRLTTKRWWFIMAATTLAALAQYFASAYLCGRALGLPLSAFDIVAGASVAAVLALLPVSIAGIGTRDAAFVVIFGQHGIDAEHAVALSSLILAWMLVNCVLFFAAARLGLRDASEPRSDTEFGGATSHESVG